MPLGRKKLKSVHPHRFSIKTLEWLGTRAGILRTRARLAKNRTRAHYADIHSHPASFECHFRANAIPCRPDKKRKQGDTRQANVSAKAYRIFSQVHGCNIAGICKPAFHRRREARGSLCGAVDSSAWVPNYSPRETRWKESAEWKEMHRREKSSIQSQNVGLEKRRFKTHLNFNKGRWAGADQ